eukprot:TRINITY_DN30968_c0_g1_i1.p1 TRINITY_DN30968_c0_g1~~TRINITY_DN30968_c0_g1_i1.p1  ORF type:complete len:584 (+),score=87.53 TRINITY_DN30968_c0_g1_i1:163-1914(+)
MSLVQFNDEGARVALGTNRHLHAILLRRSVLPKDGDGRDKYYCGRHLGKDAFADPHSDGRCGPSGGPQCESCLRFQQKLEGRESPVESKRRRLEMSSLDSTPLNKFGYPLRPGNTSCGLYLRTGYCKFGAECRCDHPEKDAGAMQGKLLNLAGMPLRPGIEDCRFGVRCNFGASCRFNHPEQGPPDLVDSAALLHGVRTETRIVMKSFRSRRGYCRIAEEVPVQFESEGGLAEDCEGEDEQSEGGGQEDVAYGRSDICGDGSPFQGKPREDSVDAQKQSSDNSMPPVVTSSTSDSTEDATAIKDGSSTNQDALPDTACAEAHASETLSNCKATSSFQASEPTLAEAFLAGNMKIITHKLSMDEETESGLACNSREDNPSVLFTPELLDRAPTSAVSCKSFLMFLDRLLGKAELSAPTIQCAADMCSRLTDYADCVGRLAGLKAFASWEKRAKRALDLTSTMASAVGIKTLRAAEVSVEHERIQLDLQLRDRCECSLESLLCERVAWAQQHVRREWLAWCVQILKAREASLLSVPSHADGRGLASSMHDDVDVLRSLLHGTKISSAAEHSDRSSCVPPSHTTVE